MKSIIRRLAGQTGIYTAGNVLIKLGGLLVIPVYINVLSPEDFGRFVLLDVTARVLILIAGMGIAMGLLKFATGNGSGKAEGASGIVNGRERHIQWSTALASVVTLGLVGFGLMNLTAVPIADGLLADAELTGAVRLMAVFVGVKVIQSVPMMILRLRERPGLYVTAAVGETVLLIGSVYMLVIRTSGGIEGIVTSYAFSSALVTAVLLVTVFARLKWALDLSLMRRLVVFGAPLTMAALAGMFMNIGDRYLLRLLGSIEMVAAYDWAARLGGVVNMLIVQSFQLAFAVIGLKMRPHTAQGAELYRSTFVHYTFWTGWAVLGLGLLSLDLTILIADKPEYAVVDVLVFPIAIGFMAYGLYYIAVNVLYASGRTGQLALLVVLTAGLNALLNVILIPVAGILGAALATVIAYSALAALAFRAGADVASIRYPWSVLARTLGILGVLYAASLPSAAWGTAERISWRLLLIAAYPILSILAGTYSLRDASALLGQFRER